MEKQLIAHRNYRLEILEDGIVQADVFGEIDLDSAKNMIADRKRISNNEPVKALMFASDIFKLPSDVMKYLSSDEAKEGIIAGAIVVSNSIIAQNIINVFIKMIGNSAPAKLFPNKNDALKWLNSF